jgi:hypothetical protein
VAVLKGGIGTTAQEVLVSLPVGTIQASDGSPLTGLRAFTAQGNTSSGPGTTINQVSLSDATIPIKTVKLGIATTGTPQEQVTFSTPAILSSGNFVGQVDTSSLSPGQYDLW